MFDLKKYYVGFAIVVCNCILFILLFDFAIGIAVKTKHYFEKKPLSAEVLLPPPYDNVLNRERFLKKIKGDPVVFTAYRHWKDAPRKWSYYNTDKNGVRLTVKNPVADAKKVFMFGGSTLKGDDVGDEMTIASRLQERLGNGYDVYNYAQNGYRSTQQVNYLLELLANGKVPDVVIVYGGLCDGALEDNIGETPREPFLLGGTVAYAKADQTALDAFKVFYDQSNIAYLVTWLKIKIGLLKVTQDQLMQELADRNTPESIAKWTARGVHYFLENIRVIKALGDYYGFESYFFWEPALLEGDKRNWDYENEYLAAYPQVLKDNRKQLQVTAKKAFVGKEAEHMYYLGDLFKDTDIPVFVDISHLGPQGSDMVAEEIYERIQSRDVPSVRD